MRMEIAPVQESGKQDPIVVCGWHDGLYVIKFGTTPDLSHGICPACADRVLEECQKEDHHDH
jgi:hypothetical protein